MEPRRPLHSGWMVGAAVLLAALPECGGSGGVCEESGASDYELCSEKIDESHCNMLSPATWFPGTTCADLGYTVPCPSESAGCFCKVGDPYCP